MSFRSTAAAALAGALIAGGAHAHHAISLNYDTEQTGSIEGVVEEVFWANPHVHYYLTVTREDGSSETWDMETGNIRGMRRRGITRDTVRPGDRVEVSGTLGREGSRRILASSIVKADGTVVMADDSDGSDDSDGAGD